MAKSSRKRSSAKSTSSSRDSASMRSYKSANSHRSASSHETHSTAPTSAPSSPRMYVKAQPSPAARYQQPSHEQEDISPSTSCYPRSSVETYDSRAASDADFDGAMDMDSYEDCQEIPPLPAYRREVADPHVRPSNAHDFAKLFPSMDRLSIRHDDFTSDGNMNLRVDTVAPGRRRQAMQLFHLRMHDLARREFSLRRYCRESGREVCNSKRKYIEAPGPAAGDGGRPTLQRSVTSAIKSLGGARPQPRRADSGGSLFGSKSSKSTRGSKDRRPSSSHSSSYGGDDELHDYLDRALSLSQDRRAKAKPVPSNTIKLEFSNYARVDVSRRGGRGSKRYEFEWWGHRYAWKRVVDKNLGSVSFHLLRDGAASTPIAHIVPETRSPTQVQADEQAGGWVPPCHMWIADRATVEAMTDVADVVVATGLMALVDDCIKERWQTKKVRRIAVPLTSRTVDVDYAAPRAFVHGIFHRRNTDSAATRYANTVAAY